MIRWRHENRLRRTPASLQIGIEHRLPNRSRAMPPNVSKVIHSLDHVVVFDGVCNLCAYSVKFILSREANPILRFTPLQSPAGAQLMRDLGFDANDAKTFVLIADGKTYVKSDAAIHLSRYFSGAWALLRVLKIIPRPIRDWAYDVIATNRYRWFGRKDSCMVPTPAVRERFIHDWPRP